LKCVTSIFPRLSGKNGISVFLDGFLSQDQWHKVDGCRREKEEDEDRVWGRLELRIASSRSSPSSPLRSDLQRRSSAGAKIRKKWRTGRRRLRHQVDRKTVVCT
jgi:hypothetical protein